MIIWDNLWQEEAAYVGWYHGNIYREREGHNYQFCTECIMYISYHITIYHGDIMEKLWEKMWSYEMNISWILNYPHNSIDMKMWSYYCHIVDRDIFDEYIMGTILPNPTMDISLGWLKIEQKRLVFSHVFSKTSCRFLFANSERSQVSPWKHVIFRRG